MSHEQFIRPEPVKMKLGPLGFHKNASDFLRAAASVEMNDSSTPVPYYLCCHSLELILKAFLLAKGVPLGDLKRNNLGHDLISILRLARSLGLHDFVLVTPIQENEIRKANDYYKIPLKGFEYFRVTRLISGYPDLPKISILTEVSQNMIQGLEELCLNAV